MKNLRSKYGERFYDVAKNFMSLQKQLRYLSIEPQIGDPEWGYVTKAEHKRWLNKAKDYAAEWSLGRNKYELPDDDELASTIATATEQRLDSILWEIAEQFGFADARDAYANIETVYYDL